MSIFVPSSCQIVGDSAVSHVAWSAHDQIVAMSAFSIDQNDKETYQVLFANSEGEMVQASEISHDAEAAVLKWHPTEKILAIGWADGMVSTWSADGRTRSVAVSSNTNYHTSDITLLSWNANGKRLISGDKKGSLSVWAVDARGTLTHLRQFKRKGEITCLAFCTTSFITRDLLTHKKKTDIATAKHSLPTSFFFGTDRGAILHADDLGHSTEVTSPPSATTAIDHMLFFEEKSRLVVVTRSLLLTQYQVSEEGKVSRVSQIKIGVAGDVAEKGLRDLLWAGPGLLVAAAEEKLVRFFDLVADETYNLLLSTSLGGFVDRSDRVARIAFSPVDRQLSLGTAMGIVAVYKFNGVMRDLRASNNSSSGAVQATSASDWELVFRMSLGDPVLQLSWWSGRGSLVAVTDDKPVFLNESLMHGLVCGDLSVLQEDATRLSVYFADSNDRLPVDVGMQVRGLAVGRSCFVVWSGKAAKVFKVDLNAHRVESPEAVRTSSQCMAIADASYISAEAWFVAENTCVKINNFGGTQKGVITFSEAEGAPQLIDVNGRFAAVLTNKGCIKIVDVYKPTDPKLRVSANIFQTPLRVSSHTHTGTQAQREKERDSTSSSLDPATLQVRQIRINASGTVLTLLCERVEGSLRISFPDTRLVVFDAVRGSLSVFDFARARRFPVNVLWDESDDRLFACETHCVRDASAANNNNSNRESSSRRILSNNNNSMDEERSPSAMRDRDRDMEADTDKDKEKESANTSEVYLMFVTSEQGVLMQDSLSHTEEERCGPLVGFNVPHIYFRRANKLARSVHDRDSERERDRERRSAQTNKDSAILVKTMRDFVGMQSVNDVVKSALLDFSFFLTLGKLDDAYRVVKEINSPVIWENMAQMCVKTKRVDVAEVCLGNMGNARGAAAVREAKREGSVEVVMGVLAIQLGLLDDAAALFREAKRYDMLNKLYQAAGFWEKAIRTAEEQDRIHLQTTHYKYAKYLESVGAIDEAIEHFERSGNARTEVPRMLFHLGRVDDLGEYVLRSEDASLAKWWASYLESIDRLDKAQKYYFKAKDHLSLVRIFCFKGDLEKAADIVNQTGDRASAYHFARQLESQGEFQEAITFYALSGCYNHSIRLAREHNLDSELMRFALKSTPALMVECAQHFEAKEEYDKAVQLYHKGGDIPRALELCFRIGEENPKHPHAAVAFDMLNSIAQDLGADSSPQTLARVADFLVQHRQYDKAIELYVMAKRYLAAIEMVQTQRVALTDELVEKLSPPEGAPGIDPSERKEILRDLAKALKKQGSFTLASKKYTQAGDRVRAIKCLVRSGDTKAVIQFASISRNAEIYTLAANYLQQMNWRESMDIMKAIIMFYTKAKAFMQLAGFYESCAQVEIDEYRDYEKAVAALNEALKYLAKETSSPATANTSTARAAMDLSQSIEKRVLMIEKFIEAKNCVRSDPQRMIAIFEALLQDPHVEEALRVGDLLGMLTEYFYQQNNMQEAYHHLREMEDRKIQPFPYVEPSIVHDIFRAVGVTRGGGSSKTNKQSEREESKQSFAREEEQEEEELEEEIDEVLERDESPSMKIDPRKIKGLRGYRK